MMRVYRYSIYILLPYIYNIYIYIYVYISLMAIFLDQDDQEIKRVVNLTKVMNFRYD